jgi:hypothetical protein
MNTVHHLRLSEQRENAAARAKLASDLGAAEYLRDELAAILRHPNVQAAIPAEDRHRIGWLLSRCSPSSTI